MGPALECSWYTEWHFIRENWFSFANRYQFVNSTLFPIQLEARQVLCMLSQPLKVPVCTYPISGRHCFLDALHPFWLTQSFCLLFCVIPEPWWGSLDGDIPFKTEYSKVLYSLHIVQVLGSVLIPIYCMMKLLWWGMRQASSMSIAICN